MQQAYWVGRGDVFDLGHVATHFYLEIESAELDLERLNLSWQKMIQRHDMLRTIILPNGRQQVLAIVPPYEIGVQDLRGKAPSLVDQELESIRNRMSHQILPSDRWPLFDFKVSCLDEKKFRLHLSLDMLIMDGRGQSLLFYEWSRLYRDLETDLPALQSSFNDYVAAEQKRKKTPTYEKDFEYWRGRLSSLPPGPDLPLTINPASSSQMNFINCMDRLDSPTWDRIKRNASRRGITPSVLLLAAYAEVIRTWSKNPEFTINVTTSNQLAADARFRNVMGNYTSSVLLGVANHREPDFMKRALQLQQQLREDLTHSTVSGVEVLREINRRQQGDGRVIMPVVFTSMVGTPSPADDSRPTAWLGEADWLGENVYTISQASQVWIDCQAREQDGDLIFNWDGIEALFPDHLMQDMFAAYSRLLRRLADDTYWEKHWPEVSQGLVPPRQLEQRDAVNRTDSPISDKLLHQSFMDQVPQRPDQPAVITSERTIGYQELYDRACQIGHQLRIGGARPNSLVAVVMEKGWEQIVGVLGVLFSGSAYLPIDASIPGERLRYLLEHGQVSLVLTQSKYNQTLEWPDGLQRVCVDLAQPSDPSETPVGLMQKPEDLAYVIYTSGSTGLPKGVMIDHRGAVNTIEDINQRFGVTAKDRVLALSALNFDLSVYDVFGILGAGGTIVIPDACHNRNPEHWAALIGMHDVTIWNTVPALMQMLVEYLTCQCERLPEKLRLVMMSGDWIPLDLPNRIRSIGRAVEIVSLGGATEASIWSILHPIEGIDPSLPSIPYGKPMLNQTFHVFSEAFTPCPVWVPGMLYIGGIGLAKGYWRDKEKTENSFIVHPLTQDRLYRTGDMGRYLPDGNIEFLGREDFQVKIRGHRIELGEIETALLQFTGVKAAIVNAVGEQRGSKRLIAYVVPKGEDTAKACQEPNEQVAGDIDCSRPIQPSITCQSNPAFIEALKNFLQDKLPGYMVPGSFLVLNEFPLSSNGKVDRKALPVPDPDQMTDQKRFRTQQDALEIQLAKIFEKELGVHSVGTNENFFDLGGDSLLAVQVCYRIRKLIGKEIPVADLFKSPTVEKLAAIIRAKGWSSPFHLLIPFQPLGTKPPFFCIHGAALQAANLIGLDQPFYGSFPHGFDGTRIPLSTKKMAADYLKEIRIVQPEGPYYLGGYSFGGMVAFEIAQQLKSQGQKVALLVLIDTINGKSNGNENGHQLPHLEALSPMYSLSVCADANGVPQGVAVNENTHVSPLSKLRNKLGLKRKVQKIAWTLCLAVGVPLSAELRQHYRLYAFRKAAHVYQPDKYDGEVVFFRSTKNKYKFRRFWQEYVTREMQTHDLPGDHFELFSQPSVGILAEKLKMSLEEAYKRSLPDQR